MAQIDCIGLEIECEPAVDDEQVKPIEEEGDDEQVQWKTFMMNDLPDDLNCYGPAVGQHD